MAPGSRNQAGERPTLPVLFVPEFKLQVCASSNKKSRKRFVRCGLISGTEFCSLEFGLTKDLWSTNLVVNLVAQIRIQFQSLCQLPEVLCFGVGVEVD